LRDGINNNADTCELRFIRFSDLESGDSTLNLLEADSIISKTLYCDSISTGNEYFDYNEGSAICTAYAASGDPIASAVDTIGVVSWAICGKIVALHFTGFNVGFLVATTLGIKGIPAGVLPTTSQTALIVTTTGTDDPSLRITLAAGSNPTIAGPTQSNNLPTCTVTYYKD
jgi:hypothetical protein